MVASADYLDVQIAELTKQKQEKIKILEECQKSNKGFKIAGLTTLGVSTIGIGVNIGEAIKIKGQKSDIADKEKQLDELDSKISSTKILIVENNTCGPSECQGDGDTAAVTLNGAGPVCINNVWAVKSCDDGFSGRLKKCKRKGVEIEYYDACTKDASFDTCGSDICNNEDKETVENRLHGKPAVCIQGNWAVKSCDSGFGGRLQKCKRQGVEIEYYDACTKDAAFNTCGSAECDESTRTSKEAELNGAGALCVDKKWTVQTCNQGYIGEKKQCTREGTSYDFYFKCEPEASFQSCGSANCTGEEAAAMETLHGKPAICINNNWAVQSCDDGYSGIEQQCNRNGVLVKYYHQCTEQSGRNTCGGNNCTGDGSAEAAELNGRLPICVGNRWHVTVCNDGYSGVTSTCTRDGVPHSYYANGCSKVIVPDGVSVKDLGGGEYAITIERGDKTTKKGGNTTNKGDKTTNEGDENTTNNSNTTGDSNSYTYHITSDGVIKRIDETPGEPGNYTYTTHNGDVYNIENVIIGGGSGSGTWNGFLGGGLPMPTGITGGGNVNLSIGVGGTSTIDFSKYFDCEDLSVSATSSNSGVVETSVKDAVLTIMGKQKTTNAETVEVTVNCGGTATKYTYSVTVNEIGADINIGKEISGDDSKIKNTEHNGADGVIETIEESITTDVPEIKSYDNCKPTSVDFKELDGLNRLHIKMVGLEAVDGKPGYYKNGCPLINLNGESVYYGSVQYKCPGKFLMINNVGIAHPVNTANTYRFTAKQGQARCADSCQSSDSIPRIPVTYSIYTRKNLANAWSAPNYKDEILEENLNGCIDDSASYIRDKFLNKCYQYCSDITKGKVVDENSERQDDCQVTGVALDFTAQRCLCSPTGILSDRYKYKKVVAGTDIVTSN